MSATAHALALETIAPEERTLPALLTQRAKRLPDKRFLADEHDSMTGTQALQRIQQRAAVLNDFGLRKGDKVAIMAPNNLLMAELLLACGWLGIVAAPINPALKGTQLQHVLNNSDARLMICNADRLERLGEIDLTATQVQTIWILEASASAQLQQKLQQIPVTPLPSPTKQSCAPADIGPGDPLAILYTSGTSGPAKGVICPHAQFYWWGIHTGHKLELTPNDTLYNCLPLFHTNALNTIFQALVSDADMIIGQRFSASRLFSTLSDNQATITYLLGAMIPILLAQPPRDTDRQHAVRLALGPSISREQQQAFEKRFGFPLLDGYASTETNFIIGGTIGKQRPGFMGQLTPGFEAKVVDENDEAVAAGEVGELLLRATAPFAFSLGYYKMPEATIESRTNLWFHTGDRVSVDNDGYFRFVDRLKDMIRRRGENISSYDVEMALSSFAGIEAVAVYAVESDLAEEEVMAALTLKPGFELDYEQLIEHCQKNLAYFAVPRYFRVVEQMPLTENGKIQKYKLREEGVTPDTWDREQSAIELKR